METLIYSIFLLKGILDKRNISIRTLFVNGCSLLCKRTISIKELKEGHNLSKLFCNQVKKRYGPKFCVPNMHLMLHVEVCVLNYGPF